MSPDELAQHLEEFESGADVVGACATCAKAAAALRRLGRLEALLAMNVSVGSTGEGDYIAEYWPDDENPAANAYAKTPLEALLGLAERLEREEQG